MGIALLAVTMSGCGVTKLWGGSDPGTNAQKKMTLREQAVLVSEPLWDDPEGGSFFGRIAGVLISGKESADTATAAFNLTGSEDETVKLAAYYLELKGGGEGARDLAKIADRVMEDLTTKDGQATGLVEVAHDSLKDFDEGLEGARSAANLDMENAVRKRVDGDRRALTKAVSGLKSQLDVFVAARTLLAEGDTSLELLRYDAMYSKLDSNAVLLEDALSEIQRKLKAPTTISP